MRNRKDVEEGEKKEGEQVTCLVQDIPPPCGSTSTSFFFNGPYLGKGGQPRAVGVYINIFAACFLAWLQKFSLFIRSCLPPALWKGSYASSAFLSFTFLSAYGHFSKHRSTFLLCHGCPTDSSVMRRHAPPVSPESPGGRGWGRRWLKLFLRC